MVEKLLLGVMQRNIPGPDGIGGRILKNHAIHFFCFVFILSLYHHKVPCLWKDAIISRVLKNTAPQSLSDYRPVTLTSLVLKSFENSGLFSAVHDQLAPLQFAYKSGRGVNDALCTLMNMILSCLEIAKSFVRLVLIDSSLAFNCIHILASIASHFS